MSTIAVLTSGESGANSLIDINGNFSNLNTDKLEAATTATLTNKTTIGLKADGFLDTNGNKVVEIDAITAATGVNFFIQKAAATGQAVIIQAMGTDTDVYLNMATKGAGTVRANGIDVTTISGTQILTNKTLTSPIITTPALGVATATSINKVAFTAPTTAATIAFGTDNTTQTFQGTDTIVGRTTIDTLTNKTLTTPTITKPVMNARNQTAQTYTPASGGTATLDLSLGDQHYVTFPAGNITLALSNDTNNQIFLVSLTQDSSGSRTVTWFTTIKFANGTTPTLTTTANKRDTFGFIRTGSGTYDGFIIGQNI